MRGRGAPLVLAAALAALAATHAAAQGGCAPSSPATQAVERAWAPPLDRPVSLRARDVSLREALDRLSAAARVDLSYSSDLLPLSRRVCISVHAVPLGSALLAVLGGTSIEPKVLAGQVVLAPVVGAAAPGTRAGITERDNALEAIVVTGSPAGAPRRSVTVGLDVIDGRSLALRGASTLPDVLNATVPGVWAWRQPPSSLLSQFGSIRGASSFGASYPKVYVDGVEAANPLLVTEIDPDEIDRVEVIRGPQGAALYGSDAISGVINIVTRHEGADGAGARTELRSTAGMEGSAFARPAPTWEHRLAVRTGSNLGSAGLALTVGRTGAIFPGADATHVNASANARRVLRSAILNASFRVSDRHTGAAENPLLNAALPAGFVTDSSPQSVRQYTLATSATIATQGPWTHTILVGVDGYRLNYQGDTTQPLPFASDSALLAARGSADRATFRASSTLRLGTQADALNGTVTFAAEHAVLRQRTASTLVATPHDPDGDGDRDGYGYGYRAQAGTTASAPQAAPMVEEWRHDTGIMAQAAGSWRDAVFATGGVRFERSDAFGNASIQALPMLGAAWVARLGGGAELKLRAAYGRGIRPARTPARDHLHGPESLQSALLDPEAQAGIEAGAELYVGSVFSAQATRFDQRATGLIQNVALAVDTVTRRGHVEPWVHYALQNVGAIGNRGWEMQMRLASGAASLAGTLSLVDSRVLRLAAGYGGDLRPGDRMLGVPATTAGLTAQWAAERWTASLTAERAWSWVNYDRIALATAAAADTTGGAHDITGAQLRSFWRTYSGDANLAATFARQVRSGLWLTARGDNLLGRQLGEPDNLTIRAGRALTLGIRASF